MGVPNITFKNDRTKISSHISCNVSFSVNENFRQFEARATLIGEPYGRGIGTLIMQMQIASPNFYPANTNYSFVITDETLANVDGNYRISLYAMNSDGIWSDAIAFEWDGDSTNGWDKGIWT